MSYIVGRVGGNKTYERSYAAITKNASQSKGGSETLKEIEKTDDIIERISDVVEERIKKYIKEELEMFKEAISKKLDEMEDRLTKKINNKIKKK